MADEIKCPVCGKVGISDYHTEDTVCPQCGSDLSIFRVIDQIPQTTSGKRNIWIPIAAVAIVTTTVLGGILITQRPMTLPNRGMEEEQVARLQDSIKHLNAQISTNLTMGGTPSTPGFKYVIKKGDSFWSISQRFYHTGTRYEEIATANGLESNSKLIVGDTLIIK